MRFKYASTTAVMKEAGEWVFSAEQTMKASSLKAASPVKKCHKRKNSLPKTKAKPKPSNLHCTDDRREPLYHRTALALFLLFEPFPIILIKSEKRFSLNSLTAQL